MKIAAIALLAAAATLLPASADRAEEATLGRTLGSAIDDDTIPPVSATLEGESSSKQDAIATRQGTTPVPTPSPTNSAPGSFSSCEVDGVLSQTSSNVIAASYAYIYRTSPRWTTEAQRWARCYSLTAEGCSNARVINSVTFGVRRVVSVTDEPVDEPVDVRINIYKDSGCLNGNPGTGGELVATVDTQVTSANDDTLVSVDICSDIEILPSEAIRVEIEQVEDGYDEFAFWPGFTEQEPPSPTSGDTYFLRSSSTSNNFFNFPSINGLILDVQTEPAPAGEAYLPANYWVPPLDKPGMTCDNVRLKIPEHGEFTCLNIGEGICRDNGGNFGEWRFGVEEVEAPPCELSGSCQANIETSTFPVLIDPANTRYPITGPTFTDSETGEACTYGDGQAIRGCNYAGATHICISENIENDPNRYSAERPFMFFYNEKTHQYLYQLVCDGIGEEGKLPELKMVNQEDLADATYVKYPVDIVKFKKGATPNKEDSNELWKMYVDWDGFEDPGTSRVGKLASFIGVAHPKLCKEYVSATDKPCWKEDCNDGSVATPDDYERDNCFI